MAHGGAVAASVVVRHLAGVDGVVQDDDVVAGRVGGRSRLGGDGDATRAASTPTTTEIMRGMHQLSAGRRKA